MNPRIYNEKDRNPISGKTAKETWWRDRRRRAILEKMGYEIIEIWEDEIREIDENILKDVVREKLRAWKL